MNAFLLTLVLLEAVASATTTVNTAPHSMERTGCNSGETFAQYAERLGWSDPSEWDFMSQTYAACRDPDNDCGTLQTPPGHHRRESVGAHHLNFMIECIRTGRVSHAVVSEQVGDRLHTLTCKGAEGNSNLRDLFRVSTESVGAPAVTARLTRARRIRGADTTDVRGIERESDFLMWSEIKHDPNQCWLGRALTIWRRQCYPVDYRSADSDHTVGCPNDFDGSTNQLCENYRPGALSRAAAELTDGSVGTAEASRLCRARGGITYARPAAAASRSERAAPPPPPAPATNSADSIRARDAR